MPRIDPSTGHLEFEDVEELVELFHANPEDPWWPDPDPETEPLHDEELDVLVQMVAVRSSIGSRSPSPRDEVNA